MDSHNPDVLNIMRDGAGNNSDVAVSGSRSDGSFRGSSGDSSSDDDDDSRDSNVFYDSSKSDSLGSSVSSDGDESTNSATEGPGGGVKVAHALPDDDVEILDNFARV